MSESESKDEPDQRVPNAASPEGLDAPRIDVGGPGKYGYDPRLWPDY